MLSLVKVIIKSGYSGCFPDYLNQFKMNNDIASRVDENTIARVEVDAIPVKSGQIDTDCFKEDKNKLLVTERDVYVGWCSDYLMGGGIVTFRIVEVDTSKRWTIDTYDNSEGIEYLDDYTLVDKALNFWLCKR